MTTPVNTPETTASAAVGTPTDRRPVRRFIQEAGRATQTLGFGRVVGQIYAYLYFSHQARTLADLEADLGISKGSASMGVRRLEGWGAVRRIWRKGDRKDYYAAEIGIGKIIRRAVSDAYSLKMDAVGDMLANAAEELPHDDEFIRERIEHLESFRERARKAYENPIVQHLLG